LNWGAGVKCEAGLMEKNGGKGYSRFMAWLDHIMACIRRLPAAGTPEALMDTAAWESRLFDVLLEAEKQRKKVEEAVEWWKRDGVLGAFLVHLSREVRPSWNGEPAERILEFGLRRAVLGTSATAPQGMFDSRVRAKFFQDAVLRATQAAAREPRTTPPSWVTEYLVETGLIRRSPCGWALSETGRILADLAGADARRWILHVEVRQSMGPYDDFRVHRSLLGLLLGQGIDVEEHPHCAEEDWPGSEKSIRRLDAMYVIEVEHTWGTTCRLVEENRALLEELIADPPVPLSILADSLVRDQRDRSFEPWLGHRGPDRATENLLAARMVAHEVRNVVVPLRATLRRFVEEVGTAEDTARMGQHRTRMEEGLARLLSFADEQLRVASLGIGPRSPFPLLDAITDAVHLTTLERNSRVSVAVSPDIPRVSLSGVREHLVSVLVNLIRNAACSRPADPVQVWIRARFDEETVVLMVDDNGPGVPPDLQNRIFEQGFSLRGGSGQGLSLARTLLGDMRAEIRCEDSPEGGARFILEIPVLARTP